MRQVERPGPLRGESRTNVAGRVAAVVHPRGPSGLVTMRQIADHRTISVSGLPPQTMSDSTPSDVTVLLARANNGDVTANEALLAAVYDELHQRAATLMRGQPATHTLQATALVNEAYIKLVGPRSLPFENRTHFLAVAATAMRQILVDHARSKGRAKRAALGARVPLDGLVVEYEQRAIDLDLLDRAMSDLAAFDPEMARAVELRFFAEMTAQETADVLEIPLRTFERRWRATRSWLMTRVDG